MDVQSNAQLNKVINSTMLTALVRVAVVVGIPICSFVGAKVWDSQMEVVHSVQSLLVKQAVSEERLLDAQRQIDSHSIRLDHIELRLDNRSK